MVWQAIIILSLISWEFAGDYHSLYPSVTQKSDNLCVLRPTRVFMQGYESISTLLKQLRYKLVRIDINAIRRQVIDWQEIWIVNYNSLTFMATIRRNNDLDDFISNGQSSMTRLISPRNVYHEPSRNVSPNRITQTRRPMISPVRSPKLQQTQVKVPARVEDRRDLICSNQNHAGKRAEYYIKVEDEDVPYCGICATQAASKGFTVNKIGINAPLPQASRKKAKCLPNYPQYQNNRRYQQLLDLLTNIMTLQGEFKKKEPKFVAQKMEEQEKIINDFYDAAGGIVERIREQHLQQVHLEWQKSQQLAHIIHDDLKVHMEDLNEAWDDIEETLLDIVVHVDNVSYQKCMREYTNSLQLFSHKLEESEDKPLPDEYSLAFLQQKLSALENQMRKVCLNEEPKRVEPKKIPDQRSQSPSVIKNVHNLLPKSKRPEETAQTAFRNLFPDDEGVPQASPQFKAF